MRRTATTGNAILGLLALRQAWSTWEITQQLRRNMRFFWPRAESRIYDEARALVSRGLAESTFSHTGRRRRTTYEITPEGRRHVEAWLATAPRPTTLECEPLLRILLGRLATPASLHGAVDQVRADGAAILEVGRRVAAEYAAGSAPFQDDIAYRSLVFDFLTHHALTMMAWADRADAVLSEITAQSPGAADEAARRRIMEILTRYPPAEAHDL